MASVPHYRHQEVPSNSGTLKDIVSFSIEPDQRRLRHIKSVIVKSIRLHNVGDTKSSIRSLATDSEAGDLIKNNNKKPELDKKILGLNDQMARQLRLQELNSTTFFDCFYTISDFLNLDNPFHISPVFGNIYELNDEINFVSLDKKSITINLFINYEGNWRLMTQYHLKLSFLVNLGDNLDLIESQFCNIPNFLLLRLTDDCYYTTMNENLSIDSIKFLNKSYTDSIVQKIHSFNNHEQPTCSFDQIMKLNNFTVCILDLIKVKQELGAKIQAQISNNNTNRVRNECLDLQNKVESLRKLIRIKRQQSQGVTKKLEVCERTKIRRMELTKNRFQIDDLTIKDTLSNYMVQLEQIKANLNLEKARSAKDLQYIFQISQSQVENPTEEPSVPPASLQTLKLKLFDYQFPPGFNHLTRHDLQGLNSSLGYLSLLLLELSKIMDVPLIYPIHYLGSNSYIIDSSNGPSNKMIYPLFLSVTSTESTNVFRTRFRYALYLFLINLNLLFKFEKLVNYKLNGGLLINFKILLNYLESFNNNTDANGVYQIVSGRMPVSGNSSDELNDLLISQDRINHIKMHLLKNTK